MKPIKKGMTEAITRDGRKVTQLTWFDAAGDDYPLHGVIDNIVLNWTAGGRYFAHSIHKRDLFAIPVYEYKVLYREGDGKFGISVNYYKSKEEFEKCYRTLTVIQLIEESKRDCE